MLWGRARAARVRLIYPGLSGDEVRCVVKTNACMCVYLLIELLVKSPKSPKNDACEILGLRA